MCGTSAAHNREEHFRNPGRSVISPGYRAFRNSSCTRRTAFSRLANSLARVVLPAAILPHRKNNLAEVFMRSSDLPSNPAIIAQSRSCRARPFDVLLERRSGRVTFEINAYIAQAKIRFEVVCPTCKLPLTPTHSQGTPVSGHSNFSFRRLLDTSLRIAWPFHIQSPERSSTGRKTYRTLKA